VQGDKRNEDGTLVSPEKLELWKRDPVEGVKELLGNEMLHESLVYAPERVYADSAGTQRKYSQMWMADWWWDMQVSSPNVKITLCSLISLSFRQSSQLGQRSRQSFFHPIRHTYLNSGEIKAPGQCT
jgi:hypothetical protein